MRPLKITYPALTIAVLTFHSSGCASLPAVLDDDTTALNAPVSFSSYQSFIQCIAERELKPIGLLKNNDSMVKLAMDSKLEVRPVAGMGGEFYVFTPHYFTVLDPSLNSYDAIRGAQGNGTYYILMPARLPKSQADTPGCPLKLIGILTGNTYEFSGDNYAGQYPMIITWWHESSGDGLKNVYKWDNGVFKLQSSSDLPYR